MRHLALLLVLLLAGCDRTSPRVNDDNVTTEMLERVSKQRNVVEDVSATARLQPLGPTGVIGGRDQQQCQFRRGEDTVLLVVGESASALINGARRNLRAQGLVGATGGFFRDREIGVSVGVQQGGPARIVVTNRLTEAREEATGNWSCEGN